MVTRVFAVTLAAQQAPSTADPPVVHLAGLSSVSSDWCGANPTRHHTAYTELSCAGPGLHAYIITAVRIAAQQRYLGCMVFEAGCVTS